MAIPITKNMSIKVKVELPFDPANGGLENLASGGTPHCAASIVLHGGETIVA